MDVSGHKHRGVLTADDMARWTPHVEAPLTYDYRGYTVCKTGPWGQGPVTLAAARVAQRIRSRRARSDRTGFHPSYRRMLEARLRRPRSILRRSRFRRRADGDAVVRRLQRRAPQARHRQGFARTAPGLDRRFRRGGEAAPRCRAARGRRRRADRGPARLRRTDRRPDGQHPRRHRAFRYRRSSRQHDFVDAVGRLAAVLAGDSRARLLPRHAARRCSGSRRVIRRRSAPAGGRAPRCRRRWRCATASRTSPGARPAATGRISGSRNSFCVMSTPA